jgi:hypothetical protein
VLALTLAAGCQPTGSSSDPSDPGDKGETAHQDDGQRLPIDADRMLADIEHLASDALAGRYTLSDQLAASSKWLASADADAGLVPIGDTYEIPFPVTVGAKLDGEQKLAIAKGKRTQEISDEDFGPLPTSASATVEGDLVFVGYAAQAAEVAPTEPDEDGEGGSPGHPAYDDLAGLELEGKVALVLLDAPGRPDFRAFFEKLQALAKRFAEDAKPLLAGNDESAMRSLHEQARKELGQLVDPFTRGLPLPDSFWKLPDDVLTDDLGLQRLLAPLMTMDLPGPQFAPGENFARTKIERLAAAGVAGVVLVRGPRSHLDAESRAEDALPDLEEAGSFGDPYPIPVVQMHWKAADKAFRVGGKKLSAIQKKIDVEQTPKSRALDGVHVTLTTGVEPIQRRVPNVVGKIEGTDLRDEIVVLGAHYDHLGTAEEGHDCTTIERKKNKDSICNGADDNASGSAMVLEIARAFHTAGIQPRRTLIFTHFAGEELGLFGSKALAQDPPWDKSKVVAMVNLDMVGRLGRRGLAVGGIGSSEDWMPLLDRIGANGMSVLYERAVATRSDHANFYREKIPVLFFFTGIHADYHRAGDHADKINVEGLRSIGEVVAQVMLALADGHEIHYTPPADGDGLSNGLPGDDPTTVEKRVMAKSR